MQINFPILILDLYVDEPTCLGVPPFIATYPRYLAGALMDSGIPISEIQYLNIDQLRGNQLRLRTPFRAIFIIGGYSVPGKYLRTAIGTREELVQITDNYRADFGKSTPILIGGPFHYLSDRTENDKSWLKAQKNLTFVSGDLELLAYQIIHENQFSFDFTSFRFHQRRNNIQLHRWAVLGAFIVQQSIYHPHIIAEMETYRGCPRHQHCSFCTEPHYGRPDYRTPESIADEMSALLQAGITRFRLGRQADLLNYGANLSTNAESFVRPNPTAISSLYSSISRLSGIQLLHLDNTNPGTIYHYPKEARESLETIVAHHSAGDTAAMGIESFDPKVIAANHLKLNGKQTIEVVRLINEIGGSRIQGIPILLPGINLLHGLPGEDRQSFQINFQVLQDILQKGYLLRRINIRQVTPLPNTPLANLLPPKKQSQIHQRFLYYRNKIRSEIDSPLLKILFPIGTVLHDVFLDRVESNVAYSRPLWSYPITCKLFDWERLNLNQTSAIQTGKIFFNCIVIGYEERSLQTAILPIEVNHISYSLIQRLPGIGKSKRDIWVQKRPFANKNNFLTAILPGKEFSSLIDWIAFD